jgi:hypothetical protein
MSRKSVGNRCRDERESDVRSLETRQLFERLS